MKTGQARDGYFSVLFVNLFFVNCSGRFLCYVSKEENASEGRG